MGDAGYIWTERGVKKLLSISSLLLSPAEYAPSANTEHQDGAYILSPICRSQLYERLVCHLPEPGGCHIVSIFT